MLLQSVSSRASRVHLPNQDFAGNGSSGAAYASFAPHASSGPASVRPAPSSLASNSTIGVASVLSAPQAGPSASQQASGAHPQRPHVQRDKSSSQRINIHKKKGQQQQHYNLNSIPRKFGGAETAGSEADESHVANSEAPMIRRKVSRSATLHVSSSLSDRPHSGHQFFLTTQAAIYDFTATVRWYAALSNELTLRC
jgi:hypothetical protein